MTRAAWLLGIVVAAPVSPSDISRPIGDVARRPSAISRPIGEVARPPSAVSRPIGDVSVPPDPPASEPLAAAGADGSGGPLVPGRSGAVRVGPSGLSWAAGVPPSAVSRPIGEISRTPSSVSRPIGDISVPASDLDTAR